MRFVLMTIQEGVVETNEEKIATKGITGTEGDENIKTLRKVVAGAGFEPTTFGL